MSAWFKCFPERILESYDKLNSDQRACAYTLTMLIYQHDGPLALSESNLAGRCGFNLRKYRRVISELMALGKFYVTPAGSLSNERADELLEHRRAARDFGSVGGKKRAANAAANRQSKKIDREQIVDQIQNIDEKTNHDKDGDQGSLEFGFKYIERDTSVPKGTGADAPPPASHWDLMAAALAEESGKPAKTERAYLANLARELKGRGGDEAFRQIILAAFDEPRIQLHSWLRKAVDTRKRQTIATVDRPTIALCRLGEFRWCHDWTTHENFTTEGERRIPLNRPLTEAEQAEVNRAVDAGQTMRRAA